MAMAPDLKRRIEQKRAAGQLLAAFDEAAAAIAAGSDDLWLKHAALVLLARLGAVDLATERARHWGIAGTETADTAGLIARLQKVRALGTAGPERRARLCAAAELYERGAAEFDSAYLHVNAATLYALSGEGERARRSAARALAAPADPASAHPYWFHATTAEALLVLGRLEDARKEIAKAVQASEDLSDRATTIRQVALLIEALGLDPAILDPLRAPVTIHYTGHRLLEAGRPLAELEAAIARVITARRVGFGYGSLSGGADILIADAILGRGGAVHVVLPAPVPVFRAQSVMPCGETWARRFDQLLADAEHGRSRLTFEVVTEDHGALSDAAYAYTTRLAMGLAALHARAIAGEMEQIAVWDGAAGTSGAGGTGGDVAAWTSFGLGPVTTVPAVRAPTARPETRPGTRPEADPKARVPAAEQTTVAILFGDFVGFSKLREDEVLAFEETYMRVVADIAADHADAVRFSNTWGDAVHMVFAGADEAASFALALQDRLRGIDLHAIGLGAPVQLRLACHFGPVHQRFNPVRQSTVFCGTHLSRCARIEPVAIPGRVFVSEAFAAELALTAPERFRCEYVGSMETAKGYGKLRMYLLVPGGEA
jgi:hypothetical protein